MRVEFWTERVYRPPIANTALIGNREYPSRLRFNLGADIIELSEIADR